MRILTLVFLSVLLLGNAYAAERARPRRYNPRQRIDLDLNGKNLGEVLKELKLKSGVDFIVGQDVARPEEFPQRVIHFDLRDMTVGQCLDWVARALGTRYRVMDNGEAIIFTSSYRWLDSTMPIYNAIDLGMITTWEERDDLFLQVKELLKVYAVREPQYKIRIRTSDYRLEVNLPSELQSRLDASFRAMLNPGREPQPRELRNAAAVKDLRKAMAIPVNLDYDQWLLSDILADLSFQADLNIGFDHSIFWNRKMASITLRQGRTTLQEALDIICEKTVLEGILLAPSQGIWLTGKKAGEFESNYNFTLGREILWEDLPVVGYTVPLLARRLGEENLLQQVRAMIPIDASADPSVGVIYHARSGNLIVIAPEVVQEMVEDGLAHLESE